MFDEIMKKAPQERIFNRFATTRYKQFFYPIRPLFTLGMALFVASLGFFGILPMSWAIWLALIIGVDDLSMTPFLRLTQAIENLKNGRKQTKAIVTIAGITFSIIVGAALSIFVLAQLPLFMTSLATLDASLGVSACISATMMIAGALIGHATGKISAMNGAMIGGFIAGYLPFTAPVMLNAVFMGTTITAFVSSLLIKQGLRMYYKMRYGHSNADGYEFNHENKATPEDSTVAAALGATPEHVTKLRVVLLNAIKGVRNVSHFGHELTNTRRQLSNSFKDIYFALIHAKTDANVTELTSIIRKSQPVWRSPRVCDTVGSAENNIFSQNRAEYTPLTSLENKMRINNDMHLRTLFHKQGLEAALFKFNNSNDTALQNIQSELQITAAALFPA